MLRCGSNRQHFIQDAFQRHGVAADSAQMEEFAIALPVTLLEPDLVIVVVAAKRQGKLIKMEAIGFLCIPLGLFDFSDHSVIHDGLLWKKKGTRAHEPGAYLDFVSCRSVPRMAVFLLERR
jgi:hypothetical protein